MARISKAEKLRRVNEIRQILARGGTRSECLELVATQWGLKPRSADFYIHEASQQIVEDFSSCFWSECGMELIRLGHCHQAGESLGGGLSIPSLAAFAIQAIAHDSC